MPPPVLFEELVAHNGRRIGVATLACEKTLHAISLEMVTLLTERLLAWQADPQVAMVLLQAQGDKAFCAGGDLQQLYRSMREHHAADARDDICANRYACDFFEHEYRLDYLLHTFGKPVLAWGHGIVMGGGIGLMAGCSHRVVTERSRLAMPEITIGLYPDVGGSWFLARMPGKTGLFLALTGAPLNACDAVFADLADYRVAQHDRAAVIETLLAQPWGQRDDAQLLDEVLGRAQQATLSGAAVQFAPSNLRRHYDLIDRLCRQAGLAAIVDGILAIDCDDAWLTKAAATLRAGAPGSAALAYALQRRVRQLSLAQVFRLELVVSLHCAARPDFVEGVRALIIEKDQQPHWQPASLAAATPAWVEGFFADPWSAASHPLADLGG